MASKKNLHRPLFKKCNRKSFQTKLLLCFLLFSITAFSQHDSNQGSNTYTLKTKLSDNHRSELRIHLRSLDTARSTNSIARIHLDIAIVHIMASYYLKTPRYDSIYYYANKAFMLTKDNTSLSGLKLHLHASNTIATTYTDLGNRTKALKHFDNTLRITENIKNPSFFYKERQGATTETAIIIADQGNYKLAIKHYESLLNYVEKHQIDKRKISSIVFMKLAGFHRKTKNLDIAFTYANKALKVAARNKLPFREAMAYLELASIKLETKEYDTTKSYLSKAFTLLQKTEYTSLLSRYYQINSVLADNSNDKHQKIYYAERAFDLLHKKRASREHIAVGKLLSEAYKEVGEYQKALNTLEEVIDWEKNILNQEELNTTALLEIHRRENEIMYERKQKELEQNNSQIKNIVIMVSLVFLFIAIIITVLVFKDRQKKILLANVIEQKNEQLKELDLSKSRFFANISHELRTPLTLVSGPIEQILNETESSLDPTTKRKLTMVRKNTDSLKTLINDILDLSKLKANKLTLNTQSIKLTPFLKEITQRFNVLAEQKGITFDYHIKDLTIQEVEVDSQKLEKIIINLLSNAFKYTPRRGNINLSTSQENNQLQIIISDSGRGISENDLPYIFDRYFQSNDPKKPLEGGSGIGLSLVKELINLMEGEISVKSNKKTGSTFKLTVPLVEVKTNNTQPLNHYGSNIKTGITFLDDIELTTKYNKKKQTILIVEDHTEMQQYIASVLNKKYDLIIANNGEEALQLLSSNTIDLIISDIMMPIMDGYELLETVKQSNTIYQDIPFIMLTALTDISKKLKALTIGVDDYLTKPFAPKELLARVHNLIYRYHERKKIKSEITIDDEPSEEMPNNQKNTVKNKINELHSKADILLIEKAAQIIEENLENPEFKLIDLTTVLHLGERQLRRKIKMVTGLSPKKFQQEIILQKARIFLESETYGSVKAISLSVGMPNVSRFSKLYEIRYGKHPNTYFQLATVNSI